MKIVALDFETANHSHVSICAAGIAIFEDGKHTHSHHWLVRPPQGHGWFLPGFIEIHGITHQVVADASDFSVVAAELLPIITQADLVVAHNASFDMGKLKGTLHHFGIPCPQFACICSCQTAKRAWPDLPNHRLNTVAAHIGHSFHHHNALDDAEAAGHVLAAILKERGETWVMERITNPN